MSQAKVENSCLHSAEYGFDNSDRREVRIHCRINVQFRYGDINDYGECWNLGSHGMYIAYDGEVEKENPIEISFVLPEEYPSMIDVTARIIWTNTGSNHSVKEVPPGFGVEFDHLSEKCRIAVQKFIDDI